MIAMSKKNLIAVFAVLWNIAGLITFPVTAQERDSGTTLEISAHSPQAASDSEKGENNTDSTLPEIQAEKEYEDEPALNILFGGTLETVHGVQLLKPFNYSASRVFAKLFTDISYQNTAAKISATAEYNYCNPSRTRFHLYEAYLIHRADSWDFSAGRQHIAWGQADGFRLTNRIAAQDLTEITAVSDKNIAVDSIRFRVLHDIFTFETIAIPFFTPDILPPFSFEGKKAPYSIDLPRSISFVPQVPQAQISYGIDAPHLPRKFVDTEFGARFAFFLPGIDFSFSGFYGWDKMPRFMKSGYAVGKKLIIPSLPHNPIPNMAQPFNPYIPTALNITLRPEYYRIGMAGFDMAIPVDPLVIRFETAYINGKYFEQKNPISEQSSKQLFTHLQQFSTPLALNFNQPLKKHQLLLLAGFDLNKDGWFFSMQYFEDLVFSKKDELERPIHEGAVSLSLSKTLVQDKLKLSASGIIGVNYGDTASSYSLAYNLSDLLTVSCGADVYTKGYDGKGKFSALHKATTGWIKAVLNF